jgi:iron-siderophore transport system permease protein
MPPTSLLDRTPGREYRATAAARLTVAATRRRRRARSLAVSVALAAVGFALFCVSLSVGDFPIPLSEVLPAIFGQGGADSDFIVGTLRLPRALTAVLVGAAFGLSGAVFQAMARNPLASPDIIGISAGANAAAVFVIVMVGAGSAIVSLGAVAGALGSAAAIYFLAWKRGVSSYRLVLVGIAVGAVAHSITSYLLTRAEIYEAQRAMVWLTGSLNGRGWEHVRAVGLAAAVLIPAALYLARPLGALQLGDDTAKGIGAPVERARAGLVVVAVALTGVATAAAGPVVFMAFLCGPIARRLTRGAGLNLVAAALTGSVLLLAADLLGRRMFAPTELPVGIITGVIGGPYLLWLMSRANRVGKGG